MATRFFISYTTADKRSAEWIAWQLEAAGHTATLMDWDFTAGRDWMHEVHVALDRSERMIAVLSASYLQSAHAGAEWRVPCAMDPTGEKGLLVLVRVAPCEPSGLLTSRVFIDLLGESEESARDVLLRGVKLQRAKPSVEPEFPEPGAPSLPAGSNGVERKPFGQERFAALVPDPRPVPISDSWTAVKLGEGGARRRIACRPGGPLIEHRLFEADRPPLPGTWTADDGELTVRVGRWTLTADAWPEVPGVWLGSELDGLTRRRQGFAVVRVGPLAAKDR